MKNKTYDKLKWVAMTGVPVTATLVIGIGELWGINNAVLVAGTITLLGSALGGYLGISSKNYSKTGDDFGINDDIEGEDNEVL